MEASESSVDIAKDLTGFVRIKRKRIWVHRFIIIKSCILYYYKSPTSAEPRFILHLPGCQISKDSHTLTLDISKQATTLLKIQLTKQTDLLLWHQYLSKASEGTPVAQECSYSTFQKLSFHENSQLLDRIPKSPLTPLLTSSIKDISERNYQVTTARGSSVYSSTTVVNPTPSISPQDLVFYIVSSLVAWEIISYVIGGYFLVIAGMFYIPYFVITGRNKQGNERKKEYFKCSAMVRSGVGEILVALHDTYSRPIWEPYLLDCSESTPITFTYQYNSRTYTQEITRILVPDQSHYYVIEKTADGRIKNLFKIEKKNKRNEVQCLVTQFGSIDSELPPIAPNPDLLTCFKIYVESSTLYLSISENNPPALESEEEEVLEGNTSFPEDSNLSQYNNEALRLLKEAEALIHDPTGWEDIKLKTRFVRGSRRKAPGGLYIIRAEGEINRNPAEIVDCLKDLSRKAEYDPLFENGYIVQLLSQEMGVVYQKFKSMGPISGRDFCLLQKKFELGDGVVAAVAGSIEHPDCPETKCVRAQLHLACHYISPIAPGVSKLVYVIYLDVKGSIPKFVINSVQSDQAMFVEHLRIFLS